MIALTAGITRMNSRADFVIYGYPNICMARVLSDQIKLKLQRPASSSDYDSMRAFTMVSMARRKYPNWVAGERTATKETIAGDLEQLYGLEQAAVSIEMNEINYPFCS